LKLNKKGKHTQGITQAKNNTLLPFLHSTTISRMLQKLQSSENYELDSPSTSTCPTIHTISVEQESENYRRHLEGENGDDLASEYGALPSSICRLIQKCNSNGNLELNRLSVDRATSILPYALAHLVQAGKTVVAARPCTGQKVGVANDATYASQVDIFIPASRWRE
jgi:hypothetical protein